MDPRAHGHSRDQYVDPRRARALTLRGRASCNAIGGGHARIPESRILDRAALAARKVDVHDAEALRVALRPFEVVEQAPAVVAADAHAVVDGARQHLQMAA